MNSIGSGTEPVLKVKQKTEICRSTVTRGEAMPGKSIRGHTSCGRLPSRHHTGVVCENMHAFGANLRKLPRQAKICTPPGGAMLAKIYGIFLVLLACAA